MEENPPLRAERADARRNRDKILLAARRVLVERGTGAPLDEIVRRAGVGAGTLYRRFPNRPSLMRAVAHDILNAVAAEADTAWADEPDGFAALTRYMHKALELRIGAVMPALASETSLEHEELLPVQNRLTARAEAIVERARREGTLRNDVTAGDIGMLLIRLSRPLPRPVPEQMDDELAHRHLDIVLAGLRTAHAGVADALSGPAMDIAALRRLSEQSRPSHESDSRGERKQT